MGDTAATPQPTRGEHLMAAYGSRCIGCNHLASEHRWDSEAGGSLVDGPYICTRCGCSQPQDGPWVPITRTQYESYIAAQAAFADPETRARFEAAIERTNTTEPVPDDFGWLSGDPPASGSRDGGS